MRRIVNFRGFLVTVACVIAAVFFCVIFSKNVAITCLAASCVALLASGIYFTVKRKAVLGAALFISIIAVVISGVLTIYTLNTWKSELDGDTAYNFIGKISSASVAGSSKYYVLDEVTADGMSIDGSVRVYFETDSPETVNFLRVGDNIGFTSEVRFNEIDRDNLQGHVFRTDVRYTAYVKASELTFISAAPSVFDKLSNKMKEVLDYNMGEYGAVALGMITGDRGGITDEVNDYYSASGLGHILSVSGLHVGFVVIIITWLCKRFRANRYVRLVFTGAVLILYCALAGFAPSMVRASIMCMVGLFATTFGKHYDPFNSLCLAVTLILTVKPLYLFDVGFQMSVAAILGILFFSKGIERILRFIPAFIARPIAVSVAAELGIAPIMLIAFNVFPTYSIFVNVLVIPLVTFAFILLVPSVILAMLIPQMGIVLSICGLPLVLVDLIAELVNLLPFAQIRLFSAQWLAVIFLLYFACSRFCMLGKYKPIAIALTFVFAISSVVTLNVPLDDKYSLVTVAENRSVTCIVRSNGKNYLVGDCKDYYSVDEMLSDARIKKIDALYLTAINEENASDIVRLSKKYELGNVYCDVSADFSALSTIAKSGLQFYLADVSASPIRAVIGNGYNGFTFTSGKVRVLILGYGSDVEKVPLETLNNCAIIRAYRYQGDAPERIYIANYPNAYEDSLPIAIKYANDGTLAIDLASGAVSKIG